MPDKFEDLPLLQRYLILTGAGMGSSKRGIQQLLHGAGLKNKTLGTTDADIKDIDYAQKAVDRLSEATPGGWAADLAGQFADPATLLAGPLAKVAVKGVKGALATARANALTGALSSGVAETREGDSRLGNLALGGATNTFGDVVGGAKKIWAGDRKS